MPNIALCDDDPRDLERLAAAVAAWRPQGGDAPHVSSFASPLALLDRMEQGTFDLYLLDVIMPDAPLQGIELGRRIREMDEGACIVYLTVSPDFALEAYGTHPFDYLLKPVEPARLAAVLDKALAHAGRRTASPSVVVKTAAGLVRLRLDDVAYAETAQRAVRYRLRSGDAVLTLTRRTSFKDAVAPLLESGLFAATSSSHVVNLHCIAAMGKTSLRLENGVELPLTRLRANDARRAWLGQWLPGADGAPDGAGRPEAPDAPGHDAPAAGPAKPEGAS